MSKESVSVRVDSDFKRALKDEADSENMKFSQYIREILRRRHDRERILEEKQQEVTTLREEHEAEIESYEEELEALRQQNYQLAEALNSMDPEFEELRQAFETEFEKRVEELEAKYQEKLNSKDRELSTTESKLRKSRDLCEHYRRRAEAAERAVERERAHRDDLATVQDTVRDEIRRWEDFSVTIHKQDSLAKFPVQFFYQNPHRKRGYPISVIFWSWMAFTLCLTAGLTASYYLFNLLTLF